MKFPMAYDLDSIFFEPNTARALLGIRRHYCGSIDGGAANIFIPHEDGNQPWPSTPNDPVLAALIRHDIGRIQPWFTTDDPADPGAGAASLAFKAMLLRRPKNGEMPFDDYRDLGETFVTDRYQTNSENIDSVLAQLNQGREGYVYGSAEIWRTNASTENHEGSLRTEALVETGGSLVGFALGGQLFV